MSPLASRAVHQTVTRKDHDRLVRWAFGKPRDAAALLRAALPRDVSAQIDWHTLEPAGPGLVDQELRGLEPDLLFRARWRDAEAYLFVVFEHQSTPDRWMAWRMLRAVVHLLERWRERHAAARALPHVVPVVLYHGPGPWRHPHDVRDLFAGQPEAGRYLPALRFYLEDLGRVPDPDLRKRTMTALGRLVLLALKHGRTHRELARYLVGIGDLLRQVVRAPSGHEALVTVLRYLYRVNRGLDPEELVETLSREVDEEVAVNAKTAADRLIEKGRHEGRHEGREEGRREGEQEILRRQLELRFGPLTPEVLERLARADAEQLELWAMRVLTAERVEGVFGK